MMYNANQQTDVHAPKGTIFNLQTDVVPLQTPIKITVNVF